MPSFRISITASKRAAARFITGARRKILLALEQENAKRGLRQTDLARTIGVHRSVINRELRGQKDITLGRIAELASAMGRTAILELPEIAVQSRALPTTATNESGFDFRKLLQTATIDDAPALSAGAANNFPPVPRVLAR
jgi:transcriptional regulator with XRE-family HTH domain